MVMRKSKLTHVSYKSDRKSRAIDREYQAVFACRIPYLYRSGNYSGISGRFHAFPIGLNKAPINAEGVSFAVCAVDGLQPFFCVLKADTADVSLPVPVTVHNDTCIC